jgi:CheY-like chemotaxis protein
MTQWLTHILLVDDNPGDIRLFQDYFTSTHPHTHFSIASNGCDALVLLGQAGQGARASRPDLIVLDLGLPGKNGWEILAELKADPALCTIPIILLSTLPDEADADPNDALHPDLYLQKPMNLDGYPLLVQTITDWWMTRKTEAPEPGR